MLYRIVRFLVRISLHFYIKRIGWEGAEKIPQNKPLLFAPTHGNSFLDALYHASGASQSVYCLARGDAFRKPAVNRLLRHFRVLPIFRQSEKEENAAEKNEQTFTECQELFRQNQWVLIFPEGVCKYQKEVLPMKKGASLMAQRAWSEGLDLHVVPVTISYDSLTKWGKKCDVIVGNPLKKADFEGKIETFNANEFNDILHRRLSENLPTKHKFEGKNVLWGWFGQMLYFIGWVFHFPLYMLVQYLSKRFTHGTVFYDSVAVGLLSITLPLYYLILGVVVYAFV